MTWGPPKEWWKRADQSRISKKEIWKKSMTVFFRSLFYAVDKGWNTHPGNIFLFSDDFFFLTCDVSSVTAGYLCLLFRPTHVTANIPVSINKYRDNPQQTNTNRLQNVTYYNSKELCPAAFTRAWTCTCTWIPAGCSHFLVNAEY